MEELWTPIEENPKYLISNTGFVMNDETGRLMKLSVTRQGALKVGFFDEQGYRKTLSVKVLVAKGFVFGHDDIFNTPIQLDGNQLNVNATNLMWRPRHYAIKYARQLSHPNEHYEELFNNMAVLEVDSGVIHANIKEAGMLYGLLFMEIWKSCVYKRPTSLTMQTFEYLT